jgi:hypothetical protein
MKILPLILIGMLGLAGCNESEPVSLIKTEYKVIDIPPNLYAQCPAIGKLPAYSTLGEADVARLISRLYFANLKCHNAILGIKDYLVRAKVLVEKGQEPVKVNGKSIY